jgi:nucleoside-diphosphate-sugar epimerase
LEDLAPLVKQKGYEITIEPLPARPFDVASNVLDSSKLMNISGWKPEIAFQTGLQDLVDSVLSQHQS